MMYFAAAAVIVIALLLWWALRPAPGYDAETRAAIQSWDDLPVAQKRWEDAQMAIRATGDQYLIVGAGFLGCHIVKALLKRGEHKIRCFDLSCSPLLQRLLDANPGKVEYVKGDVTKPQAVEDACKDVQTVYCTFAIIRYWEVEDYQRSLSHNINVGGTENVISACKAAGVLRLIQTSTSNTTVSRDCVTYAPTETATILDEDSPYVTDSNKINHYGSTKAIAERKVLAASSTESDGLCTGSIRPCSGIFGANDNMFLQPSLANREIQILVPWPVSDIVYVDNVVYGHILLEQKMCDPATRASVSGHVFAISNQQPMSFLDYFRRVAHYDKSIKMTPSPYLLTMAIARVVRALGYVGVQFKPPLHLVTPAMFDTVRATYVYKCDKAVKLLGYRPIFSVDEGIMQAIEEFASTSGGNNAAERASRQGGVD